MRLVDTLQQAAKSTFSALARLGRRVFAPRVAAPPGHWVYGKHSTWRGRLLYSPWLSSEREYQLHVPAGYASDERLPLIVMLHGCQQDPDSLAAGTRLNQLADAHNFLVLYPRQSGNFNPYRCWNWFDFASQRGWGEAAIIAGMVKEVRDTYAVDRHRVYLVGISAGGALASILANCYPQLFAAVAIHSGLAYRAASAPWQALEAMRSGARVAPEKAAREGYRRSGFSDQTMPVIVFHGSVDEVVNPINAEQVISQFAWLNHYANSQTITQALAPTRVSQGSADGGWPYTVTDYEYAGKPLLRVYLVEGMGHAWSGGDPGHPYNDSKGPDATRLIWEFLSQHRR